jgi:hypothetical protein
VTLVVDGHPATGLYDGRYFSGSPITVVVPRDAQAAFSGWTVNGSELPHREPALTLTVESPLDISPRFSDQAGSTPAER